MRTSCLNFALSCVFVTKFSNLSICKYEGDIVPTLNKWRILYLLLTASLSVYWFYILSIFHKKDDKTKISQNI